ncbi:Spermatogenesis-associated protein [Schistosoma japonicum]|uniref:Spermatogenesis-associated protein n=1 Tax=Schistosoma japonicum TaxID=6182 RepID=A0A4Z2DJ63_SCHJA|nr:spermatogenesis-associated protein 22 [Schistosoma japonicum]TNN16506.1 Spermatogenesis-associated protein [Schistosoma japonicum]
MIKGKGVNIFSELPFEIDLCKLRNRGKEINFSKDEHVISLRSRESTIQSQFNNYRHFNHQSSTYSYSQHKIHISEDIDTLHHKLDDNSLRVISTQIRRLRGICTYLSRNTDGPVIYEIYGRCISKGDTFTNIPGVSFVLQEIDHKQMAQAIHCALYDFDEILPEIRVGNIYRCVGRYHCQKYIFQCFNVEQLDENEVHVMESIQYQSNLELTELTKPKKLNRVSRVMWRPNSIASTSTSAWLTENRFYCTNK